MALYFYFATTQPIAVRKKLSLRTSIFGLKERVSRSVSSHLIADRPGAISDGFIKIGTRVSPVLARSNDSFVLPEVRRSSALTVFGILERNNIDYWTLASESDTATIICIDERQSERVMAALEADAAVSHWYARQIARNGQTLAAVYRVGDGKLRSAWAGIGLYEVIAHPTHQTFSSGSAQGVELIFWEQSKAGHQMQSKVWNPRVVELPNPKYQAEEFALALERANQPLANEPDFPIDAVYTWVDGTDEAWQWAKAEAQSGDSGDSLIQDALAAARFADHDELRYSLRSIEQFAPWVRKIWIVTSGQVPEWLDLENPRVAVVTHEEIWPNSDGLPNFNSHAIEANLHRIDGLAEHYLYFNDDMILGRSVGASKFFHGNGVSKFFYSRALVNFNEISEEDNASTIAAKNARNAMAAHGSATASRKFFHTPSPLRRSVTEKLEGVHPALFEVTRKAQFRQQTDVAVAGSFYFNVAGAMGAAVPGRLRYEYIDPATSDGRHRMRQVIAKRDCDTICVNDGSTDETDEQRIDTDVFIRQSLEEFLPVASTFEKS